MALGSLPQPLLEDIVGGRCLPLVGAGFSRDAETADNAGLPLWRDLARALADQLDGYPAGSSDPLEAISAYTQEYGRVRLVEELRTRLHHGTARPGPAQLAFCRLPFDVVCTTNWDTLLERGFDEAEREHYVIVEEQQLSIGVNPRTVTLIKLHGDLDHPHRIVASEADYDRFINRNPLLVTYVSNLLITRTPLFIGYSIDDPDFRQIMAVVSDRLGQLTRKGYALTFEASAYERSRFERRGVSASTWPEAGAFSGVLEGLFRELHTRWLELAPHEIVITDERLHQELAVPVGRHGRICYFALPAMLVSFYRDAVFPLADHAGLVAATGDETLARGGTLRAMIDMLLSRADVVVADVSTGDRRVRRELRAAWRRVPPPEVAVVTDSSTVEESVQPATRVFIRPSTRIVGSTQGPTVSAADTSSWLQPLGAWLDTVGANVMNRLVEQLGELDAGRDRTAVITAASALEMTLQRTLAARRTGAAITTPIAGSRLTVLINQAMERQMISGDDANQARLLEAARTAAVHGQRPADAAADKALIDRAIEIIDRLTRDAAPLQTKPKPKRRAPR